MSETTPSIIITEDIAALKSRDGVFGLFKKLRYKVEDELRMPFEVLELPSRLKDFIKENGRAIYLIANYDRLFQIYLFETRNLHITPIKDVCRSFSRKEGDYLLLFSTDYAEILFVNPLRRAGGVELHKLRLNTRKPFHTDLQVLNSLVLSQPDTNPFDIYDLQCRAFRKERVTDDFYKAYNEVFKNVEATLDKIESDAQAHTFTQLLMNRLMLLYFVQKRGWLSDSPDFLREFYDTYRQDKRRGKSFYRDYLEPLFFGAFNRGNGFNDLPVPDSVKATFKNAPYLNGGMFVRLEEVEPPSMKIPDAAFDLMFDDLFERYNFTVREDTPLDIELAIDPELLGNVYQRLVSEEERSKAGLFYTQATEVNFMCQRAIIEYIARHIPDKRDDSIRLVMNYLDPPEDLNLPWEQVEKFLAEVKVCDPACGSGAFLVAMMHLLVKLRTFIGEKLGRKSDPFELKKAVISQNLYGVDVKSYAVRIAELRLWLSLVVDAPDDFIQDHPHDPILPNLTYRLRQGDSLIEEFAGEPLCLRGEYEITGKRIPQIIRKLYDLEYKIFHGEVKGKDLERFKIEHKKLEKELFQGILKDRMESLRAKRSTLKWAKKPPRQRGLFGDEAEPEQLDFFEIFEKDRQEKIKAIEQQLGEYRRLLESEDFEKLEQRDYVLWEIDFADVFIKGGFDIIIGNPPYVRQEEIGPPTVIDRPTTREERKDYKEKLIRSVQTYVDKHWKMDKKSDLYVYFYLLGMSLLNKNGVFVFITSNSWLDVGYGAGLQEWLLKHMEIVDVYDNQARRSFKSADVNTVIVIFNKPEGNPLQHTARFTAFKKPFEEVLSSDTLLAIENAQGIVSTDDFRVYQATQQVLLEEGLEKDTKQKELDKKVYLTGKYKSNKWGGKYLRAPDIYFRILEKAGDKLVRLGDIAEVRFGIKTGCNEFFFFDEPKTKEWGIEEEFLRPVIKSPRECQTIIIDPNVLPHKLFMCHRTKKELKNTNSLEYIKWGEAQGFHKRPSCHGRPKWYDLGVWDFAQLLWVETMYDAFRVYQNISEVHESDKFYGIQSNVEPKRLAIILNSTVVLLQKLLSGFSSLGQGALKTAVYEVKNFEVLDPNAIPLSEIPDAFFQREILNIKAELSMPDRRALDNIIFDILGLTQGEREAVYESVVGLVRNRLEKARSV